jgi:hypothetical protein
MPPNPLTLTDWVQILAAIGQCVAGIGAMLAAGFAVLTINQMRQQSEVQKREFAIRYGPKLYIDWSAENHIASTAALDHFPQNEQRVALLPDGPEKRIFQILSEWWNNPSDKACPTKFVVLNIHNAQADPTIGTARNVRGTIEMYVKNPVIGHPLLHYCRFDFAIGDCRASNTVQIPIRIEGVPEFSMKIITLKYDIQGEPKSIGVWSGPDAYAYSA